ncbi:ABC-2 type transport system permease protein [Alkalibacillus filiformis]|uniref:Transport permease protein n=1 Tax=Alkalibacillus filiformis TaxID=200990 RepID=A0ABU0DPE4_9BACI|nr:ABC transporter permease [Alkalibacillus filiformis]MDQ0350309.1 ABC-2 type transport system permease protein [Alkalibacillus filiformis]
MNQFKQMFLMHLKMTFREKQAWFWGLFFPVILMLIFMSIFADSDDEFEASVAVVEENPNEVSTAIYDQIEVIPVLNVDHQLESQSEAEQLIIDQEVTAAIVLPQTDEDSDVLLMVNAEDEQSTTTQVVSGVLSNIVQQMNLQVVGASETYAVDFQTVTTGEHELSYQDFLLTGLIALAVAQGGLFGMIDLVDMRRKGLIKRLRMTPVNMSLFGLSDMMMRLLFSVIQIFVLALIGVFLFNATLHINVLGLVVLFLVGALSFNAIGYFISSFSKTTEAYMGVANIFSFLMMFLSGIFFPVEMMPEWLHPVAHVLPLTYFAEGLRDTMVYSIGIESSAIWFHIGVMALWGVVAYIIGSWLYRRKSIVATR